MLKGNPYSLQKVVRKRITLDKKKGITSDREAGLARLCTMGVQERAERFVAHLRVFCKMRAAYSIHYHACPNARRTSDADGRLPYMRSPMRKALAPSALAPLIVGL